MSFGFSAGDFVLLIQIAHKTLRNCQKAGEEYVEIAREIRCLRSVLETLDEETERSDSNVFGDDAAITRQLRATADGCTDILDKLDCMLAKYEGLQPRGQTSASKKLWQRFRFGAKAEELGVVRGQIITYTSTLSIIIDTVQIKTSGRIESKVDNGFSTVTGHFQALRREIHVIASERRRDERRRPGASSLSLSTYAGDDKVIWREFRRELIRRGFKSSELANHKEVLLAYTVQLDQSGLLDQVPTKEDSASDESDHSAEDDTSEESDGDEQAPGLNTIGEQVQDDELSGDAGPPQMTSVPILAPEINATNYGQLGSTPPLKMHSEPHKTLEVAKFSSKMLPSSPPHGTRHTRINLCLISSKILDAYGEEYRTGRGYILVHKALSLLNLGLYVQMTGFSRGGNGLAIKNQLFTQRKAADTDKADNPIATVLDKKYFGSKLVKADKLDFGKGSDWISVFHDLTEVAAQRYKRPSILSAADPCPQWVYLIRGNLFLSKTRLEGTLLHDISSDMVTLFSKFDPIRYRRSSSRYRARKPLH